MKRKRFWAMSALAAAWLCVSATASSAADLFPPKGSGDAKAPIEITSDRLVADNTEKWADYIGSVKATQGGFSMTADALRLYYEGDMLNPPEGRPAQSSIQKMVATGRVHIVTEQYVADADRAEYVPATGILVLTGKKATVVSGKNTLTGAKIVLDRANGKAEVEGGGSERVKAVFHPEPKKGDPEPKKGDAP